jgi:uncharacterized protein
MKKVILVLMFCLPVLMIKGFSQTKQESIKQLFSLMKQDSMADKMFSSMIPAMRSQMKSQFPKDSIANARSNEMMKTITQTAKEITKKMIDEDMVGLYDKYFSQGEINDYIAFYKTPSGQKMITLMQDITKELMMIMMQKYLPEMQKAIKAKMEERKNAGQQ